MVGLDTFDGESKAPVQHPHYLRTCSKPNLELGSIVYLLGYTDKQELAVGEAKVVIATDNLIKLSTDGVTWSPGSAGFDFHGNLSFMVCDPMKLATSPNTRSTSTSSSSTSLWRKDTPMQFGIPMPAICHWLNQHWEGNLDELNKPKLPLIRLMSSAQKSEHSCASFTMRSVFKPTEGENEGTPSSSKPVEQQPGPSSAAVHTVEVKDEKSSSGDRQGATHAPGIPTPEIYESPMLTSSPVRNKDATTPTPTTQIQLLDINFPPRISKAASSPKQSRKTMPPSFDQNYVKDFLLQKQHKGPIPDAESTGSVNGAQNDVQSSSSPVEFPHEYSSEGETTMYSAETAESRNYPSPREGRFCQIGRSQSCVSYNRWGPVPKNSVARGLNLEKHHNLMQGRKVYSQGATSQRSNDYYSPTVSSNMKKRNDMEQQQKRRPRPRQSAVYTSQRWNF
ncbi:uncharacterized protein LOC121791229 isoform X2 [Salvia splendens]|nr:uncharacterized protein LOC121791229 isoform X2 [Salvia splendens]